MCSARVLLIDDDPLYVRRARRVFDDSIDLQVAASRGEVLDVTTSSSLTCCFATRMPLRCSMSFDPVAVVGS
jgi:ActR/RegA family two-component response regulator